MQRRACCATGGAGSKATNGRGPYPPSSAHVTLRRRRAATRLVAASSRRARAGTAHASTTKPWRFPSALRPVTLFQQLLRRLVPRPEITPQKGEMKSQRRSGAQSCRAAPSRLHGYRDAGSQPTPRYPSVSPHGVRRRVGTEPWLTCHPTVMSMRRRVACLAVPRDANSHSHARAPGEPLARRRAHGHAVFT